MATRTLSATGARQSITFPANMVGTVKVTLRGARGGRPAGNTDAAGGQVVFTAAFTPGQTVSVDVGMVGGSPSGGFTDTNGGSGGWPHGGDGGTAASGYGAFGGGGATTLISGASVLAVAAGGGGCSGGSSTTAVSGGMGGAGTGEAGNGATGGGGAGGTTSAGGAAGNGTGGATNTASAGSSRRGGDGGNAYSSGFDAGGGGGEGYFGGGGGGASGTGSRNAGGGGSNYISGTLATVSNSRGVSQVAGTAIFEYDVAPDAPGLIYPANNADFDVALIHTPQWTYNDLDGDPQQMAQFRYRVGSGAWTVLVPPPGPLTGGAFLSHAAYFSGHFFDAQVDQPIEWQVSVSDGVGFGPWSTSRFMTPRTAPAGPSSTTLQLPSEAVVTWVDPNASGYYQVRILSDSAGAPGVTVYADSREKTVTPASTGQTVSPFAGSDPSNVWSPSNGVTYHAQVRTAVHRGVWSPWRDSGPLLANFQTPPVPVVTASAVSDTASVAFTISNPGGTYPAVTNIIYRTGADGVEYQVAQVDPNTPWTDWQAPLNTPIMYRVVAISATGGQSSAFV